MSIVTRNEVLTVEPSHMYTLHSTPGNFARLGVYLSNRILGRIVSNVRSRVKMTPGCPIF